MAEHDTWKEKNADDREFAENRRALYADTPPNRANHPGRRAERDTVGVYGQELAAWRAADAAQRPKAGDYAAYMRGIGMGHQVPKE